MCERKGTYDHEKLSEPATGGSCAGDGLVPYMIVHGWEIVGSVI